MQKKQLRLLQNARFTGQCSKLHITSIIFRPAGLGGEGVGESILLSHWMEDVSQGACSLRITVQIKPHFIQKYPRPERRVARGTMIRKCELGMHIPARENTSQLDFKQHLATVCHMAHPLRSRQNYRVSRCVCVYVRTLQTPCTGQKRPSNQSWS